MNYNQETLTEIRDYNAQQLAGRADSYADNDAAASFMLSIRDNVLERVDYIEDAADWQRLMVEDYSGDVHEIADQAPDVYTFTRWQEFVGTAAYQEDISELMPEVDDLTAAAGIALYIIAERLVQALAAEIQEGIDDTDSEVSE